MKKRKTKELLIIFFVSLTVLILLSVLIAENSESTSSTEWRMFGRNLNHTSYDGAPFAIIPGLNYSIFTTGKGVESSPVIANGYVYIGSDDLNLYQLNASNISQKIANFVTGNGSFSYLSNSPVIANGYLYFGSIDKNVYQLNASNISQQIGNYTIGSSIWSSPIVANGSVYIGSSFGENLYQLNASNISQKIANFSGFFQSSPAVANGYVYIGSGDHNVYQLNASNISKQIANFTTGLDIGSSPAVANGYVYIGSSDHNVYQLNASNISQEIAHFATGDIILSSPAVANGYVYIGSWDNNLYQLNASNISQEIAHFATGAYTDSSPTIANGYVYVGSGDGTLYQLSASNVSNLAGKITVGNDISSSAAYANGYVYIGSDDYRVYQINASNLSLFTIIDKTPPIVTIANYPSSSITYPGTHTGSVSIHVILNEFGYCFYSLNGGTTNKTFSDIYSTVFLTTETLADGNYVANFYCNDTSGNRNDTTNVSFTMYTPSNRDYGSGLNGTKMPTTQSSNWNVISPNSPAVFKSNDVNSGIVNITITTNVDVSSASLTMKQLSNLTSANFRIDLNETIYQGFEINASNLNYSNLANVIINFKVNKTWQQNINNSNNIYLYRKPAGSINWSRLSTIQRGEDSDYYYYSANSPGFSTFLIVYESGNCIPASIRCANSQIQYCSGDNTWILEEQCPLGCTNNGCNQQGILPSYIEYLAGILLFLGIMIFLYFRLRKEGR